MHPDYHSLFLSEVRFRILEKRTRVLEDFARTLGDGRLVSVECRPSASAIPKRCFINVEEHVAKFGGRMITGWMFGEYEHRYIEGEAHAVWLMPNGRRRDITPHRFQPERLLFVEDPSVAAKRGYTPAPRLLTTSDERVAKIAAFTGVLDQIAAEAFRGMGIEMAIDPDEARRAAEAIGLPSEVAAYMFEMHLNRHA